jgi:hypothetical protein
MSERRDRSQRESSQSPNSRREDIRRYLSPRPQQALPDIDGRNNNQPIGARPGDPAVAPRQLIAERNHRQQQPQPAPQQPNRRRIRVVSTSSSSEERPYIRRAVGGDGQEHQPVASVTADAEPITVSSSNSIISDDMYVARYAAKDSSATPNRRVSTRLQSRPQPAASHRQMPNRSRNADRFRLCGEASEGEETSNSSPDESNTDAADDYRATMMGLRNRTNALHQVLYHEYRTIWFSHLGIAENGLNAKTLMTNDNPSEANGHDSMSGMRKVLRILATLSVSA